MVHITKHTLGVVGICGINRPLILAQSQQGKLLGHGVDVTLISNPILRASVFTSSRVSSMEGSLV